MNQPYTPDNTRSSIIVILLLAAGVTIVALLLGLSAKPEVSAIGVSVAPVDGADPLGSTTAPAGVAAASETSPLGASADAVTSAIELDETGRPIIDANAGTTDPAGTDVGTTAELSADQSATTAEAPTATAIPIPTQQPTAEVAPAVEPTADPLASSAESLDDTFGAPAVAPGVISGQFFTRPEEDEGATVTRNELTLTLAEDGTGSFQGVLEMTLFDQTLVSLAMSGPIRWSNETPQVTADLMGNYTLDSPIDADDVSSNDAELTISSLGSGSGSLCTETCFGFTFPPQSGL